jgi:hypothetical protein
LNQHTKCSSPEVLHASVVEELLEGELALGLGSRINDTLPCVEHLVVGDRLVVQRSEYGDGFGVSTFADEPSR